MISRKRVLGVFMGGYLFAVFVVFLYSGISWGFDWYTLLDALWVLPTFGVGGDLGGAVASAVKGGGAYLLFLIAGMIFRKPKTFKYWLAIYIFFLVINLISFFWLIL